MKAKGPYHLAESPPLSEEDRLVHSGVTDEHLLEQGVRGLDGGESWSQSWFDFNGRERVDG